MKIINVAKKAWKNPRLARRYLMMRFKKKQYTFISKITSGKILSPPIRIGVSVNSVCNARCLMCDIGQKQKDMWFYKNVITGEELSIEILKKFINDVKNFYPDISINTTEPLLY